MRQKKSGSTSDTDQAHQPPSERGKKECCGETKIGAGWTRSFPLYRGGDAGTSKVVNLPRAKDGSKVYLFNDYAI